MKESCQELRAGKTDFYQGSEPRGKENGLNNSPHNFNYPTEIRSYGLYLLLQCLGTEKYQKLQVTPLESLKVIGSQEVTTRSC